MSSKAYRGKHNHLLRRVGERVLDTVLLQGHVARWAHRIRLQGKLGVTHHALTLPPERRLASPLRIAFASDFHAGPTTHPEIFSDLFREIERQQPDLLLLGGDFVSGKAHYIAAFTRELAACRPRLGKFAVFGNHDLWVDDGHLGDTLGKAGVEVLTNRHTALPAPFANVSICGIDDPWTGAPDFDAAFHGAQATRILLMHAPDGLLLANEHKFDLAFAGHTHGGQIVFPDGNPIVLPSGPLCRKYSYGRYPIAGNGDLVVSRGIGCSTVPLRINADPELVILDMQ